MSVPLGDRRTVDSIPAVLLSTIGIAYAPSGADTGFAVKFLTLLSGLVVALLMAAAPASGIVYYPMKAEQTVRLLPSSISDAMGTVWNGELVEVHCQDRGSSVGGSTLWDYIQYNVDGTGGLKKRGWVPDYYVKTGTTGPLP